MILDRSEIEKNIARVSSGSQKGTAFLVSDDIAVTAKHVIDEDEGSIILEFLNISSKIITIEADIITNNIAQKSVVDVIFLKLKSPLFGFEHFKFDKKVIPYNSKWNTFSYPAIEHTQGLPISGSVDQLKKLYNPYDYDMILRYDGEPFNSDGVSGSPVIIDGTVRGIITDDKAGINLLGAVSTKNFLEVIEALGISFQYDNQNYDDDTMPNDTIISINSSIKENNSGYIFVKGVPGSGKTSLAESLNIDAIDSKIIGRYLVDDKNDDYSIQYKSSPIVFGKWLINCISKELYGTLIEEKDYENHKLTELVISYLNNLSSEGIRNNMKYVFILDGFDEAYRINSTYFNEIFGLFPTDYKKVLFFYFLEIGRAFIQII
ncbi:S1 family peptidase [Clostridium beijerinckii]|uniref:S1 family peptidase n=1 Tax=Clostridium beijerinckii TaxID=1520 RepID=UPI00156E7160|nr:serine protease [Clostridium beijerinckii]NRW27467.1 hypothetical protein [Clostridium beijerinckii]NYC19998.1 hypothetical protein [Clostridium beijerinckii]